MNESVVVGVAGPWKKFLYVEYKSWLLGNSPAGAGYLYINPGIGWEKVCELKKMIDTTCTGGVTFFETEKEKIVFSWDYQHYFNMNLSEEEKLFLFKKEVHELIEKINGEFSKEED